MSRLLSGWAWAIVLGVSATGCGGCKSHASGSGAGDGATDAKGVHTEAGEASAHAGAYAPVEASIADDALPPSTSDELTIRARHLLEAIQKDDGDLAADLIFPRDAYIAVKDVGDPGKHWDARMLAAFRNQVHQLHKRTKKVERATFSSFEVTQPVVQSMPKKGDLKKTLWRSKHSRLNYTIDGKPGHFDVVELTGWQGSWYVTQLRPTKGESR